MGGQTKRSADETQTVALDPMQSISGPGPAGSCRAERPPHQSAMQARKVIHFGKIAFKSQEVIEV